MSHSLFKKVFDDRDRLKSTATMANAGSPRRSQKQGHGPAEQDDTFDKQRPRPGWTKQQIDVDGQMKSRWVHTDGTIRKRSSIVTHRGINSDASSDDYETEESTDDEIQPVLPKERRLQITAPLLLTPSSTRINDGLYADCHACERSKKLKVLHCPCESARRAALSKILARKDLNADDTTYKKFYESIAAEVHTFDHPTVADGDDDDDDDNAAQTAIKLTCPHCGEDLFLCTLTPFPKGGDPFSK